MTLLTLQNSLVLASYYYPLHQSNQNNGSIYVQMDEVSDDIFVSCFEELGCAGPIRIINGTKVEGKWMTFTHKRMDDPNEISFLKARENG